MEQRNERIKRVNNIIRSIASCGREFFSYKNGISKFQIGSNGRLYFVDGYRGDTMPCWRKTDYWKWCSFRWHRFNGCGTLKDLVKSFSAYIYHGTPVPEHHFGPWPDWYCNGNLWGYDDESMDKVRQASKAVTQ